MKEIKISFTYKELEYIKNHLIYYYKNKDIALMILGKIKIAMDKI